MLTPMQVEVLESINKWMTNSELKLLTEDKDGGVKDDGSVRDYKCVCLEGIAGSGKTTLMRFVVQLALKKSWMVCCVAPTHVAKHVLETKMSDMHIECRTVASMLGKKVDQQYIGTKSYRGISIDHRSQRLVKLMVVDETSMITDIDYMALSFMKGWLVLFLGDRYQIPNPGQIYVYEEEYDWWVKKEVGAFTECTHTWKLTDSIRQLKTSDIVQVGKWLVENIDCEIKIRDWLVDTSFDRPLDNSVEVVAKKSAWLQLVKEYRGQIIAYTNRRVEMYNKEVKKARDEPWGQVAVGEVLVGCSDVILKNGLRYTVTGVTKADGHKIGGVIGKWNGWNVTFIREKIVGSAWLIDLNDASNQPLIAELSKRAMAVNEHSRKHQRTAWHHYCMLRNRIMMIEDIYKFEGVFYSSSEFQRVKPDFFLSLTDLIRYDAKGKALVNGDHVLYKKYPELVMERLKNPSPIGDNEQIRNWYQIVEKDVNYGYAITAHKSQGSTYDTVLFDEQDFDRIINVFKYGKGLFNKVRERNMLKYVAVSRAKSKVYIFDGKGKCKVKEWMEGEWEEKDETECEKVEEGCETEDKKATDGCETDDDDEA